MNKYEIIIFWSNEDDVYVADVPELPGCMAHADTYESALANAKEAIQVWIKTAKEYGDPIPKPKGQRLVLCLMKMKKTKLEEGRYPFSRASRVKGEN